MLAERRVSLGGMEESNNCLGRILMYFAEIGHTEIDSLGGCEMEYLEVWVTQLLRCLGASGSCIFT